MQGQKELAKSAKEREPATATAPKNKKIESQNEVEKAAKESEPELEQPPVKRKKVGSEMELYKEYTDERKKTELAWQTMRASSKGHISKTVEKTKIGHKAVEEGEAKEDSNKRAMDRKLETKRGTEDIEERKREKELEERKKKENFKRREMEIERRERELEEKKREDIRKLEEERELNVKKCEEDIRRRERERELEEQKREENFRRREMEIERRERELEEKKRDDIRKLEEERELDVKKSEEDIRRREREQQQTRRAEKEDTDRQLRKLQDLLAHDDDPDDGLVGDMDDLMQWPLTSTPISTAWLPEARSPEVQNSYPSLWQVCNVSRYSVKSNCLYNFYIFNYLIHIYNFLYVVSPVSRNAKSPRYLNEGHVVAVGIVVVVIVLVAFFRVIVGLFNLSCQILVLSWFFIDYSFGCTAAS